MTQTNVLQKLSEIQSHLDVPKQQYNNYGGYNYRSAEDILAAVKPLLGTHGCTLLIEDSIEAFGDRLFLRADVKFFSAEAPSDEIVTKAYAEICEHKGMSLDQCTGTASSYARKYALNALFLLDDIKDSDSDVVSGADKQQSRGAATRQPRPQDVQKPPVAPPVEQPRQSGWGKGSQQPQRDAQPQPEQPRQGGWGKAAQQPPKAAQQPSEQPRQSGWGKTPRPAASQQPVPTPAPVQEPPAQKQGSSWGKSGKTWGKRQ